MARAKNPFADPVASPELPYGDVEPGQQLGGRYQLITPLTSTDDITLWEGWDDTLTRPVLMWVIPPNHRRTDVMLLAARAAAAASDTHFLRVLDALEYGPIEPVSCIVTEYVPGVRLEEVLRAGPISDANAGWIVMQLAAALAPLHARDLFHQRLSPATVILTASGDVCISGFLLEAALSRPLEYDGMEQPPSRGEQQRADLDALGQLFYAGLTGTWPLLRTYERADLYGLAPAPRGPDNLLLRPAVVRPGISLDLDAICMQTLEPAPGSTAIRRAADLASVIRRALGRFDASAEISVRVRELMDATSPTQLVSTGSAGADDTREPVDNTSASADDTRSPADNTADGRLWRRPGRAARDTDGVRRTATDGTSRSDAAGGDLSQNGRAVAQGNARVPSEGVGGASGLGFADLDAATDETLPTQAWPVEGRAAQAHVSHSAVITSTPPDGVPARAGRIRPPSPDGQMGAAAPSPGGAVIDLDTQPQLFADGSSAPAPPTARGMLPPRPHLTFGRGGRARWLWLIPLVVVIVLVIVLVKSCSGAPSGPGPVPIVTAYAFDPTLDGGNGQENSDKAVLAVDGDPSTAWTTETYLNNPKLGGLKPGVGLVVDLGQARTVTQVTLTLGAKPVTFEVRVPKSDPAAAEPAMDSQTQWVSVASSTTASTSPVSVTLTKPTSTRWVLVYFTSLAEVSSKHYEAIVDEIQVDADR